MKVMILIRKCIKVFKKMRRLLKVSSKLSGAAARTGDFKEKEQ